MTPKRRLAKAVKTHCEYDPELHREFVRRQLNDFVDNCAVAEDDYKGLAIAFMEHFCHDGQGGLILFQDAWYVMGAFVDDDAVETDFLHSFAVVVDHLHAIRNGGGGWYEVRDMLEEELM